MSDLEHLEADLKESRQRFEGLVGELRPALFRYCSRMTGSVFDGEDLVQETLAQAYFKLALFHPGHRLKPWLFRIAHNKCIDHLRRKGRFEADPLMEEDIPSEGGAEMALEQQEMVAQALRELVLTLPDRERACVVLKDILDHSLEEIAGTLQVSVPAVKAALHRGRTKLRRHTAAARAKSALAPQETGDPRQRALFESYAALFNARDWQGLRRFIRDDAQLDVLDRFSGVGREAIEQTYFGRYSALEDAACFVAELNGEPVLVVWRRDEGALFSLVRVDWQDGGIRAIRDYHHIEYFMDDPEVLALLDAHKA